MTDSSTPLSPEYAERFLNEDTTWPPGWSVSARATRWPEFSLNGVMSELKIVLVKKGRNSSAPAPDGTYPEPWELNFPLGVPAFAMKDKDALMFWVLEKITWVDEHENREFARYKMPDGSWHAPFHPHRGHYLDQSKTPEWQAQYRDPHDLYIAGRK
jgi:hypothetical protein